MLGAELPKVPGGNNTVLYPSSAKASSDLQEALGASGFTVRGAGWGQWIHCEEGLAGGWDGGGGDGGGRDDGRGWRGVVVVASLARGEGEERQCGGDTGYRRPWGSQ